MADWTASSGGGGWGIGADRPAKPLVADNRRLVADHRPAVPPGWGTESPAPGSAAAMLHGFADGSVAPQGRARAALLMAGGALSALMVVGLGVWGYQLVQREVFGVPVVLADDSPMRVLPDDPEGAVAPNQGLAVNTIPAAGEAAGPSDVLLLAPAAEGLAPEDMEVVQSEAESAESAPPSTDLALTDVTATSAVTPAATPAATADAPMTPDEVLAYADALAAAAAANGAAPLQPMTVSATVVAADPSGDAAVATATLSPDALPAEPVAAASMAELPPTGPAPLRPAARPASRTEVAGRMPDATSVTAEGTPAGAIMLAGPVPVGTPLVQLGAFDSPAIAASEWDRLMGAYGAYLTGKERLIQETVAEGRTFYRLRASGFADADAAHNLCTALVTEGADCIPVVVR